MSRPDQPSSDLSPLRYSIFRALWLAAIASNIGSLMEAVGESWLMASLTSSALLIALAYAADSISIVLLALPAGALADIVNRRRLLIASQAWMLAVAAALGVMTALSLVTPGMLLALIALLGIGEAVSLPAFSPFMLGSLPRSETRGAVTLIGVAMNLGRGVGPAIGGLVIALSGPAAVFFINAASFMGVIAALYWSKDQYKNPTQSSLPAERIAGAIKAGVRYVRHSSQIRAVLARSAAFTVPISIVPALLPTFVKYDLRLGSEAYGIFYGIFGLGAIVGGLVIIPRLSKRYSPDRLVFAGTLMFMGALALLSVTSSPVLIALAMVVAGTAQLMSYASLGYSLYGSLPNWVTARVASFYQLVVQAALVGGSIAWGSIADVVGVRISLIVAAASFGAGLAIRYRYRLMGEKAPDLSPSVRWPASELISSAGYDEGPVMVLIEYVIDPARIEEFTAAMDRVSVIRKRDGAFFWGLFRHDSKPNVFVESFLVDSWVEHLRQHERVTVADRQVLDRAISFHTGATPPAVSHFIAESSA
ncbi:MAG: MFS transporter [Nitrososphaera sp.]|jgi:MFS family permease